MNVPVSYGSGLHTLLINPDRTVLQPSPVTIPVGLDVNRFGMAVLGGN